MSELALLLVETAGVETAGVETAAACRLLGRGDPRGDILLLAGTAAIRRRLLLHARPMYISGASSSSEQQSADMSPLMVTLLMVTRMASPFTPFFAGVPTLELLPSHRGQCPPNMRRQPGSGPQRKRCHDQAHCAAGVAVFLPGARPVGFFGLLGFFGLRMPSPRRFFFCANCAMRTCAQKKPATATNDEVSSSSYLSTAECRLAVHRTLNTSRAGEPSSASESSARDLRHATATSCTTTVVRVGAWEGWRVASASARHPALHRVEVVGALLGGFARHIVGGPRDRGASVTRCLRRAAHEG